MIRMGGLLASVSMLTGILIYLFLRPHEAVAVRMVAGWMPALRSMRALTVGTVTQPFVVFSLPNGLWAFAYAVLMASLWKDGPSGQRLFWMASIPVVGLGYEIMQYAGVFPGTFCPGDILACLLGVCFGFVLSIQWEDG